MKNNCNNEHTDYYFSERKKMNRFFLEERKLTGDSFWKKENRTFFLEERK